MKLVRKLITVIVILVMLTTICSAVSVNDYQDIPEGWSRVAIENAIENNLLVGNDGFIKPHDNLTRAQMATIVERAFGATVKADISEFQDVDANKWYYSDMAKAVQMGIFIGYDSKLSPDSNITRQEAFLVLARAFKLSDGNDNELEEFQDKANVASWSKGAISAMVKAGYVKGSGDKLNPASNITREEFVQLMDNMIKKYINVKGTYTSLPIGNVMINLPDVILKDVTVTGDLIIGDGVGDGDITLDGVKVSGRTIIRGGGVNSIKIIGSSNIKNIVIARIDGKVRVFTDEGAEVGEITVDGKDDVTIEGNVGTVKLMAPDVILTTNNAQIQEVTILSKNAKLIVAKNSVVNSVSVNAPEIKVEVLGKVKTVETTQEAEKAEILVSSGAEVEDVVVNSNGTNITGEGNVSNVKANANDIAITTPNTSVSAAEGTTGVTAGEKPVEGGTTETSTVEEPSIGGGGGPSAPVLAGIKVSVGSRSRNFSLDAKVFEILGAVIASDYSHYFNTINTAFGEILVNGNSITTNEGWSSVQSALIFSDEAVIPENVFPINSESNILGIINNYKTIVTGVKPQFFDSNTITGFTVANQSGNLNLKDVLTQLWPYYNNDRDISVQELIDLYGSNITITIGVSSASKRIITITPIYQ